MRPFESWEGVIDDDILESARGICRRLRASVKALGQDPRESDIVPCLERFVRDFNRLEKNSPFITPAEAEDIVDWFAIYVSGLDIGIADIDELDGVERSW